MSGLERFPNRLHHNDRKVSSTTHTLKTEEMGPPIGGLLRKEDATHDTELPLPLCIEFLAAKPRKPRTPSHVTPRPRSIASLDLTMSTAT